MIRLVGKKLIIPRGDTGSFSVPLVTTFNPSDAAVFSIINEKTQTVVKRIECSINQEALTVNFMHDETVNLPVGKYYWDIKSYKNPEIVDGELVNGTEVDSYYAAYSLPVCEIRQTGDNLLVADESPNTTLTSQSINMLQAVTNEVVNARTRAQTAATNAENNATIVEDILSQITQLGAEAITLQSNENATASYNKNTGLLTIGVPKGAVPNFTIGEVTEGAQADASITGTNLNPVLNLTLPNANVPTKISDLIDDSGHYTKPANGIPAEDLEETYLTSFTETDPTVPAWAKAAQKPSYTAAEVGAPTVQEMNTAIGTAIGNINSFDIAVVQALPTQDISTHTIYLVPKTGETNDVYDEYVYINNNWEMVGNTQIDLSNYVTKESIDNAGITNRTYVTALNGEFTVTTVASQDYNFPYARANVTGRFNKENQYRVTVNEVEYILSTRLWYITTSSEFKVYEYLGNLELYISDISGVPGGTDDVPFIIISDIDDHGSIDVLTNSAGTYTILVEKIVNTQTKIPNTLIYGDNYTPIEKNNNSGTYNGFSIGVNELTNKRGTIAIGYGNKITNNFSTAIGIANEVSGSSSIVLGNRSKATGLNSYAEGYQNIASGDYSHAEGVTSTASGTYSHAETGGNTASGNSSHAEGYSSIASGDNSHAEGYKTQAAGSSSHSSGLSTKANAVASFTQGISSIANKVSQSVFGKNNVMDESEGSYGKYSFIIGNGASSSARSNAYALDWDGNGHYGGDVYVGANADSTGGSKLITASEAPVQDVQVNGTSILNNGVANVPIASASTPGVARADYTLGIGILNNAFSISNASDTDIKNASTTRKPINPAAQHKSVFYGLAKAAGDTTQSQSDNAVGTYTDDAKAAIQAMLDVPSNDDIPDVPVQDVQINGTSIINNSVANIPVASSSSPGVVRANNWVGFDMAGSDIRIFRALRNDIKNGTQAYRPITPSYQEQSVFYGLTKAAGVDMASSSNPVGQYTNEAKIAIQKMLGIYQAPWELIREDTVTNDTEADIEITVDGNGQAFELTDLILLFETPKQDTASAKGQYGDISFYAGDNLITQIECGSWTQEANAVSHGITAIVKQEGNMLIASGTSQTTISNRGNVQWRYGFGFDNTQQGVKYLATRASFTKINIIKVTGTGHYKLYGKRKWQ